MMFLTCYERYRGGFMSSKMYHAKMFNPEQVILTKLGTQ